MKKYPIAIQLYTVRAELKENFVDTMKEIAALGFEGVEFALYFGGMEPLELAEFMKKLGLKTISVHTSLTEASDPAFGDFAYAKALGAETIICSGKRDGFAENIDAIGRQVRAVKRAAAANGFDFAYHNHDFEFVKLADGGYGYDKLVGEDLDVELDVYWLTKGGVDQAGYIRRYGRRLPYLHMKDRDPETGTFTELGTGDVPLAKCVEALDGTICRWLVYEQDICRVSGVESAKTSIRNLKKLLGY